jgi:hypothetical protein
MTPNKLVTPVVAIAAVVHELCRLETGQKHVPHEKAFDFYAGLAKTTAMDTSAVVSGLPSSISPN